MSRGFKISFAASLALTAFIITGMFLRPVADFYALELYPRISSLLSLISSPARFSFQGVAVASVIAAASAIVIFAIIRKSGWRRTLLRELNLLLWVFVWFYLGWCLNYSRTPIFERIDAERSAYDSTAFVAFLEEFTEQINGEYCADCSLTEERVEKELKGFYASVPQQYGLCSPKSWQHYKNMMPRRLHSAIGIMGYMGPLFSEFHLNEELPPSQIPFIWAHEYAHLLGVSSEAEANWWAWNACMSSELPQIRYSACLSMFSYVLSNALRLLSKEDCNALLGSVRPEIIEESMALRQYWLDKRNPKLDKIQRKLYDIFLKFNKIPSGIQNYSEVVQMMMDLPSLSHR